MSQSQHILNLGDSPLNIIWLFSNSVKPAEKYEERTLNITIYG